MRKIFNFVANETQVEEVATTMVDAKFISDLMGAFRKIPQRTVMRFIQTPTGQLRINLIVEFHGAKIRQELEGYGDSELISAILNSNWGKTKVLKEYAESDHEIETAAEGENLKVEILKQFLMSGRKGTLEPDWVAPDGRVFRKVSFLSSHNLETRFCVEATEEVNKLIEDACTPEWMRKSTIKSEQ